MAQPTFVPVALIGDALRHPVWTTRLDGAIDYVNPFLRDYTGLDLDAFRDGGWDTVIHHDDLPALRELVAEALRAGMPYDAELRLRRADGIHRWHLARVAPIRAPGEPIVGWVGSAMDIDDHRIAEAALRVSEARARDLVDSASELVYTLSLDGTVTAINPAVEAVLGYRPEELRGRRIDVIIAADQLAFSRRMLAAKLDGAADRAYDLDLIAKDGRRVTLEITSRLASVDGRPAAIHGIARSVSSRRAADVARRERDRQLTLAAAVASAVTAALASQEPIQRQLQRCAAALVAHVDAAFARIWTIEPSGTVLTLQASAGDHTHLDGPHGRVALGEHKIGRIAAERRPHLTNAVIGDPDVSDQAWAIREGMVAFAGYPLLVGDDLRGVLGLFARHVLDAATLDLLGSVADVIAVGIDRARVEATRDASLIRERAALRDAEAAEGRYRGLFEGVADAILVADAEGRYRDANTAALELLGYNREELLRLRSGELAVDAGWAAGEIARLRTEGRWRGEVDLRCKDGSTVAVEIRATVVALPDEQVTISALRDVGERRAMERQQEAFLEAVSHDLRNPIAVVRAQAQLLARRARRGVVPDVEALVRSVSGIDMATRRMEAQLDEFQDALRLRSGYALELRAASTDLVALAEGAVVDAQAGTGDHAVRLRARVGELRAIVDPLRLRRVLDNLLGNAVKYSPAGGAIELAVDRAERPDGGWAVLTVRDEGVGIPAGDLPHVFERYRRGSNVDGRVRGSGVGLSGVRQIVAQHGGTVAAESSEGRGSTFTVAIPLEPATDPDPS